MDTSLLLAVVAPHALRFAGFATLVAVFAWLTRRGDRNAADKVARLGEVLARLSSPAVAGWRRQGGSGQRQSTSESALGRSHE